MAYVSNASLSNYNTELFKGFYVSDHNWNSKGNIVFNNSNTLNKSKELSVKVKDKLSRIYDVGNSPFDEKDAYSIKKNSQKSISGQDTDYRTTVPFCSSFNSESVNAKLGKESKIKNKAPILTEMTIPKSLAFKLAGVLETSTRTINKNIKRNTGSIMLTNSSSLVNQNNQKSLSSPKSSNSLK